MAIQPGNPDRSLLIQAVHHANPDLQMPPSKRLPKDEIAHLEQWVRIGAPDPRGDKLIASDLAKPKPSDPILGKITGRFGRW